MSGVAVCTCAAGNYLAFVRVLAESFRRFHPDIPFYVLLGDTHEPKESIQTAGVRVVGLQDLNVPSLWKMLLRYDRKQVMTALKPAMLRYMLECGYEAVLFLDPDVLVTDTLEPALQVVASHSLTLTPHVGPAFAMAGRTSLEKALLFAGMFNGGFVGVTDREETWRFLKWWEGRLRTHCIEAVRLGLHFDQRWLDLAPGFVADMHLLRDPGCNVAYWNLPELEVRVTPEGTRVNGSPLRLFHFSGFNPAQPDLVTRYLPGVRVEDTCPVPELFRSYATLLYDAGWAEAIRRQWPWDGWRRFYRRTLAQGRRILGRPLA
jgi:hypothetical protein